MKVANHDSAHAMTRPDIQETVAFLSRPEAYSDASVRVETKQTHMSWVFLTEAHAWKLKKPVRNDYVDFSTPEARRKNCEEEVRLNRRLAADVYFGVVPLLIAEGRNLRLGGVGQPVDWLVHMRRLPSDRMLDHTIAHHSWTEDDARKVGVLLAGFYKRSGPIRMTETEYRNQLTNELVQTRNELSRREYGLPTDLLESVIDIQLRDIQRDTQPFDWGVRAGKIVEAHGDLRPEHICLEPQPVIIDCLESNRALRLLDPASELAFLDLECERLGAPRFSELVLRTYCDQTGDRPSDGLLRFYKSYHACIRAKIAVWHLRDHEADTFAKWIAKGTEYLRLVASEVH
jgi:aminoglycoside phosphotransferase family enzyme